MKIIFLDIDGVLNCETTEDRCGYYVGIDIEKLLLVKQIIDATDAKIVLCSTWRLGYTNMYDLLEHHIPYMKERFQEANVEIMDQTPNIGFRYRGAEIRQWMSDHPGIEIDEWIVLDDEVFIDYFTLGVSPHVVQTCYREDGLTEEHVKLAIQMLNKGVDETQEIGLRPTEQMFNKEGWWI